MKELEPIYAGFEAALRHYLEREGRGEQTALAAAVGISQPHLSKILNPSSDKHASLKLQVKIANEIGYDYLDFISLGRKILKGEPLGASAEPVEPPSLEVKVSNHFKGHVKDAIANGTYVPVRLLKDAVAGGAPSEIREDDVEGWVLIYADREWMPNAPDHYTCAHIRGGSMFPVLSDGDIVAIDHAAKPNDLKDLERLNGEMCAFKVNGGVTVKWLKWIPEKEMVIGVPENKEEFDHMVVLKGEEINDGIIGKVAWWWAKR